MKGLLSFDKMIMPVMIKVIFWISLIGFIVFGFFMIGYGIISSSGGFFQVGMGLMSFILGPIVIRLYCEMLIVVFKMQESLVDIRNLLADSNRLDNEESNVA